MKGSIGVAWWKKLYRLDIVGRKDGDLQVSMYPSSQETQELIETLAHRITFHNGDRLDHTTKFVKAYSLMYLSCIQRDQIDSLSNHNRRAHRIV